MQDDVVINKTQSIIKCLQRVRDIYANSPEAFLKNIMLQDAAVLNLQRAAQTAIDLAAHIVRVKGLSAPKETKELFVSLCEDKIISEEIKDKMINMVGFRNIAVHEYKKLDIKVVVSIIEKHLTDFENFMQEILNAN